MLKPNMALQEERRPDLNPSEQHLIPNNYFLRKAEGSSQPLLESGAGSWVRLHLSKASRALAKALRSASGLAAQFERMSQTDAIASEILALVAAGAGFVRARRACASSSV